MVALPQSHARIESDWAIGIGVAPLAVEMVLDKVPAVDTVNDAVQRFIGSSMGGPVFAATSAAGDGASTRLSLVAVFVPVLVVPVLVVLALALLAWLLLWGLELGQGPHDDPHRVLHVPSPLVRRPEEGEGEQAVAPGQERIEQRRLAHPLGVAA